MRIRKNDIVTIITGKDAGKKGKVLQVFPSDNTVVVEGMNMLAKNVRAKRQGEKGQVVRYNAPIQVSKVQLFCPRCNRPSKLGMLVDAEGKKTRICRRCKQSV